MSEIVENKEKEPANQFVKLANEILRAAEALLGDHMSINQHKGLMQVSNYLLSEMHNKPIDENLTPFINKIRGIVDVAEAVEKITGA